MSETITAWERRHKNCLTVRDGKPYYDWTKAKGGGEPPKGWPNGIVGRLLRRRSEAARRGLAVNEATFGVREPEESTPCV